MQANHVVVWLDHSEAHVIAFHRDSAEKAVVVLAGEKHEKLHRTGNTIGSGKLAEHPEYYEKVVTLIKHIPEWLIVGPANAKLALSKHVHKHHANLLDQMIGIETVDHPSDGQLVAFARKFFHAADQMAGDVKAP